MKTTFILTRETEARGMAYAHAVINQYLEQNKCLLLEIKEVEPTRTIEQNSKLHAMLRDVSRQVDWIVDGEQCKLSIEDWKIIFTAGLKKNQRVTKGIEGGFVMLGSSTSKMSVKVMSEMIELMYAFGAEHGVNWED
jgi:hypothetical protein